MSQFCAEHPRSLMCKDVEPTSFTAQCGTPPVCQGDAVYCAIAKATFESNCALTKKPDEDDPEVKLYKDEKAKSQEDILTKDQKTVNVGLTQFDQTNLLGVATGISDLSITVWGKAINLPLSMLNVWLERLGVVLRAVTLLLCARILVRG